MAKIKKVQRIEGRQRKAGLARLLNIDRNTLSRLLARRGAPAPDKAQSYDPAEVAAFIEASHASGSDALKAARLDEVRERVRRLRRDNDLAERNTVLASDCDRLLERIGTFQKSYLVTEFDQLPGRLQGQEAGFIRAELRRVADGIIRRMHEQVMSFDWTVPPPPDAPTAHVDSHALEKAHPEK